MWCVVVRVVEGVFSGNVEMLSLFTFHVPFENEVEYQQAACAAREGLDSVGA